MLLSVQQFAKSVWSFYEPSGRGAPEIQTWFLQDVYQHFFALCCYYALVACLVVYMKDKQRVDVYHFQQVYNIAMVLLSLYMGLEAIRQFLLGGYSFFNNGIAEHDNGIGMARIVWIYYLSKIPEWLDTVIMILKKNTRQLTFLHLYHHGSIFAIVFVAMKQNPGGDAYLAMYVVLLIHLIGPLIALCM